MRERLESTDNSLGSLETETDQIEKQMQQIEEALQKIETSISSASQRGDREVAASFQKNLSQKKAEKEHQEQAITQIAAHLSRVGNEIAALRERNESSKQEVALLESLGEDISDGQSEIDKREITIEKLEQRFRDLLSRLGKAGSIEEFTIKNSNELSRENILRIGNLEPNKVYEKNGYHYETNEKKQVVLVSGVLNLNSGQREKSLQRAVGKLGKPGDEGGHLIGNQFDGPPDVYNLIPQNSHLNRGAWETMEKGWANLIKQGSEVKVKIEPVFKGDLHRPASIKVKEWIDGRERKYWFKNDASS